VVVEHANELNVKGHSRELWWSRKERLPERAAKLGSHDARQNLVMHVHLSSFEVFPCTVTIPIPKQKFQFIKLIGISCSSTLESDYMLYKPERGLFLFGNLNCHLAR
jgi:hypothetical protein